MIRGDRRSLIFPFAEWIEIVDGDDAARELFDRHYSRRRSSESKLIIGPGEKLLLTTPCRRAIFAWRKFKSDAGEAGINCAIFRNEGAGLSSDLIRAADEIAWQRWPGERHYTYIDPRKTGARRSKRAQPGQCFIHADWQPCGITKKRRLMILERLAL